MTTKAGPKNRADLLNEIGQLNKKLAKIKERAKLGLDCGDVQKTWSLVEIVGLATVK